MGIGKDVIGVFHTAHRFEKSKSAALLFLKNGIAISVIIGMLMMQCGCGSDDYFMEIGNGYAICTVSPTDRGIGYRPNYNATIWETRIDDYYVVYYFVYDEYIGLQGCYIPPYPYHDEKLNYLRNLTEEDYYFYLINSTDDILLGPWRNQTAFGEQCEAVGITYDANIWIDPDAKYAQTQRSGT